jgi:hypothetical protein
MSGIIQGFMNFIQAGYRSFSDTFSRLTSGSLGTSSSGGMWKAIKGTWYSNNGTAKTDDAASNYSIAAAQMASSLVTLTAQNISLGTGISFLIVDSSNWYAAAVVENDSYTYAYAYSTIGSSSGSGVYYYYYTTSYTTSTPVTMNGGKSYYYHYGTAYTRVGPIAQTYYYTTYYPYTAYDNAPTSAAVTNYLINIYNSVSGTITYVAQSLLPGMARSLSVVIHGTSAIASAYSDNAQYNQIGTAVASITPNSNLHGIIIVPSAQNQGNTIGQFNAYVTG